MRAGKFICYHHRKKPTEISEDDLKAIIKREQGKKLVTAIMVAVRNGSQYLDNRENSYVFREDEK